MKDNLSYLAKSSYKEQVSRSIAWGHHFLFLNIILALVSSFAYVYGAPSTSSFISFAYLGITYLGHISFLCFVSYLIIFFPLAFIGNFRYYRVLSVIIAIVLHAILLFDVKLYLAVKIHLSLTALTLILSGLDFNTGLNYNFLYIAIPIIILIELLNAKLTTRYLYKNKHNLSIKIIVLVFISSFIASHSVHIWADVKAYEQVTMLRPVFPAHYPMTARSFLVSHGYVESKDLTDSGLKTAIVYPLEPIVTEDIKKPLNIVSISVNGLTQRDISTKVTPYLASLKGQALYFDNFYLPYTKLQDNIFASTYGLPISYKKAVMTNNINPILLNQMHNYEYTSKIFVSSQKYAQMSDVIENMGLRKAQSTNFASDSLALTASLEYIKSFANYRSYNLYIMLNDALKPNISNDGRHARFLNVDKKIQDLCEYITNSDLKDNTLIIISALIGDNHDSSLVYDTKAQRVPLYIIYPDNAHTGTITSLATAFDISPTILKDVFGVKNDSAIFCTGYNLNNLPKREYIVVDKPEILLVSNGYTTVYTQSGQSFVEKQDTKTQVKPNLENLIQAMQILNRFKE